MLGDAPVIGETHRGESADWADEIVNQQRAGQENAMSRQDSASPTEPIIVSSGQSFTAQKGQHVIAEKGAEVRAEKG